MKCRVTIPTMLSVAAIAFLAGRFAWPEPESALGAQSTGAAKQKQEQKPEKKQEKAAPGQPQMDPDMMAAWAKANMIGDAHKKLDAFLGDWKMSISFTMEPGSEAVTASGTVHREWVLDNHFIQETVEGHMGDQPETFRGLGFLGFDNMEGLYQSAWLQNMGTDIMSESGYYDEGAKTFHFRGTHRDPMTGRAIPTRSAIDVRDPNRHVFIGYAIGPDGREFKSMEGTAERVSAGGVAR